MFAREVASLTLNPCVRCSLRIFRRISSQSSLASSVTAMQQLCNQSCSLDRYGALNALVSVDACFWKVLQRTLSSPLSRISCHSIERLHRIRKVGSSLQGFSESFALSPMGFMWSTTGIVASTSGERRSEEWFGRRKVWVAGKMNSWLDTY